LTGPKPLWIGRLDIVVQVCSSVTAVTDCLSPLNPAPAVTGGAASETADLDVLGLAAEVLPGATAPNAVAGCRPGKDVLANQDPKPPGFVA